jgi:hypothetical protein
MLKLDIISGSCPEVLGASPNSLINVQNSYTNLFTKEKNLFKMPTLLQVYALTEIRSYVVDNKLIKNVNLLMLTEEWELLVQEFIDPLSMQNCYLSHTVIKKADSIEDIIIRVNKNGVCKDYDFENIKLYLISIYVLLKDGSNKKNDCIISIYNKKG